MSKSFDLTKGGGFRLVQEQMKFWQDSWTEVFDALANVESDGTVPFVVSGAVVTRALVSGTTYDYTITDGWVYYQGHYVRVQGGVLAGVDVSVDAVYLEIMDDSATLLYNDGSNPTVKLDNHIELAKHAIGTPDDASKFVYTNLYTGDWQVPSYLGVFHDGSHPVRYRRAVGSRTVRITGITDGSGSGISVSIDKPVFTLPVGMRPPYEKLFPVVCIASGVVIVRITAAGVVSVAGDMAATFPFGVHMEVSFDL